MSVSSAIILAAGRGSRMGQLCEDKPKCLLQLDGCSLLDWQLAALKTAGINTTAMVVGYQKQRLLGYSDTLIENPHWAHSSIFTSLTCAAPRLRQDTCVISYADIVYHPEHVSALMQTEGDITITSDRDWLELWQRRFQRVCDDAESFRFQGKRLLEIGHRVTDISAIQGQFMGLLKITPKGWAMIETMISGLAQSRVEKLDMTALLQLLLQHNVPVSVVTVEGQWCEVDSETDYNLYKGLLNRKQNWQHDWRWQHLALNGKAVAKLIPVSDQKVLDPAQQEALQRLLNRTEKGFHLGGKWINRDELYD